ncbi:unnamed protein product [marine sediment metagenome]|uniref:HTH HARE-type domain-containing protein n=1 Tax=marine sediment metagenome TaxID=412755 RepID=X1ALP9_9ZZZZ
MKQYEAVIKVMEENSGFATLGHLYQNVLKVKGCEWKTKTPFASMRRIVQDDRLFFKIKPGLWALNSYKDRLPFDVYPRDKINKIEKDKLDHSYYQGLLVEIGNLKNFETFVPYQDKNKSYLGKILNDVTSIKKFYEFSYDFIIKKAQTIDVSWFNMRKMPVCFFEIEYSTNIQNSLLKFNELQDFNSKFFIIADNIRKKEFEDKISLSAFKEIMKRVNFMDFTSLSEWHSNEYKISSIRRDYNL